MNRCAWKMSGLLAIAVAAGSVSAQGLSSSYVVQRGQAASPGCCPSPVPAMPSGDRTAPGSTASPASPGTTDSTTSSPNQGPNTNADNLASLTGAGSSFVRNNTTSAGTGLTSTTGVTTGTVASGYVLNKGTGSASSGFSTAQQAVILPGLFTAINAEGAQPIDRIFASYGYFNNFKVASPPGAGFDLNRFDIGAEKTLFDGRASIYVRVPFLYATDNTSGQPVDGLGDISAGFKYALLRDEETGSTLTAGMTVSAPTARDAVSTVAKFNVSSTSPAGTSALFPTQTSTINPTFLQPWVGGMLVLDRFTVQEYFAVIIPTEDKTSTFINNDIGLGYQLYRSECRDSFLTSVTPTIDVQVLLPLNHQGAPSTTTTAPASLAGLTGTGTASDDLIGKSVQATPTSVNSPYQVFVTGGVGFGIGERAVLSIGVVTPVTGPKAFTTGGTVGFNFFF